MLVVVLGQTKRNKKKKQNFFFCETKVPADVRLIESHDLKFDRSLLTGESEAVEGVVECTDQVYVESKNMAFMSTLITNGQGRGVVVCTGKETMIGRIACLTNQTSQKEISLQKEIRRFVVFISVLAITTVVILLIIWAAHIRLHYPSYIDVPTMMVNCIGVMVAFIPTGLPVAVTLSLLLIARKMAKYRVLVKNLSVIETLSCVNVIASDKTGTLTQNKMFVANVAAGLECFQDKNWLGFYFQFVYFLFSIHCPHTLLLSGLIALATIKRGL